MTDREDKSLLARRGPPRLAAKILVFEFVLGLAIVVLFRVLGLVDLRLLLVSMLARGLVWFAHLRWLWAPVEAWLLHEVEGHAIADKQLVELDAGLARLPQRFALAYALGWFACLTLDGVLAYFGVPFEGATGSAELLAITLVGLSLVLGMVIVITALTRGACLDTHTEVAGQVAQRQLERVRPARRLGDRAATIGVVLLTTGWVNAAAYGGMARVISLRQAALDQQSQVAVLAATRHDAGLASLSEHGHVTFVAERELPPLLQEARAQAGSSAQVVVAHELRAVRALAAAPMADGRWAFAAAEIDEQLGWWVLMIVGFMVAFVPLVRWMLLAFSRALWQPAREIGELADRVLVGERLDDIGRVVDLDDDEFGALARRFSALLDMLAELSRSVDAVGRGQLHVELDRPGDLHDAARAMLTHLRSVVARMAETSGELSTAAAQINAITVQQIEASAEQSHELQRFVASLASLSEAGRAIEGSANTVLDDAEETVSTTEQLRTEIDGLREGSEGISELLELIREIADRSDLLALNGSLEAVRAGEAGRGFALVATEMRRLAERVTQMVVDGNTRVAEVAGARDRVSAATRASQKRAQRTASTARDIVALTRQQGAETQGALDGVHQLDQSTLRTLEVVDQTRAATERLARNAQVLEELLAQFELKAPK